MPMIVDKDLLYTLVDERALLFEHAINVQWYVMLTLVSVCVVLSVLGVWLYSRGESTLKYAGYSAIAAIVVVGSWGAVRIETQFEKSKFERAPETYVLQKLRWR